MTETSRGANVYSLHSEEPEEKLPATMDELRAMMHEVMSDAVADVERRLAQARELEQSAAGLGRRTIHTEDLNLSMHLIDGYTLTNQSPTSTAISWANLHVVYDGVDYTIANGNTTQKYVYFKKPATYTPGSPLSLFTDNNIPALTKGDTMLFINDGGIARPASGGVSYAVGPNTVGDVQIGNNSLSQAKISGLSTTLTGLNNEIDAARALAEGSITQHFGPDFPWPNGSAQDVAKTGDVYTRTNSTNTTTMPNGQSYRWTGPAPASPENTWVLIEDTAVSKALADSAAALNGLTTKTTVYPRTTAQGAPTAPSGGFVIGDQWHNTTTGLIQYWDGDSWEPQLFAEQNLPATISGTRIGPGISSGNLTGTVPIANIPTLGAENLNTTFHMLY